MQYRQVLVEEIVSVLKKSDLLEDKVSGEICGVECRGITQDSRAIEPGYVFVAIKGTKQDGHAYIPRAIEKGATLVIAEKPVHTEKVPVLFVQNARKAFSLLAQTFMDYPCCGMTMLGVTGTNGKTTTTFLMQSILEKAGIPAAVLGTTGAFFRDCFYPMEHTTPDTLVLMNIIRQCKEKGAQVIIMEVSSHGIDQERIYGLSFALGIFTNLTQDHLDYHKNMEEYAHVKWRFFRENCHKQVCVFNREDPWGRKFYGKASSPKLSYGFSPEADIRGENYIISKEKTTFNLRYKKETIKVRPVLAGRFNVLNALAASSVKEVFQIPLTVIKEGLEALQRVPGRLEEVPNDYGIRAFVDYAHTPDALANVLKTLREIARTGSLILVFGCGGDRDKAKRPLMGEIGAQYADHCLLTNDNPRTENPEDIMLGMVRGVQKVTYTDYEVIFDRRQAIYKALSRARPGDIVLVAGKGHEEYQEIGGEKKHFSDREEIQHYFRNMADI